MTNQEHPKAVSAVGMVQLRLVKFKTVGDGKPFTRLQYRQFLPHRVGDTVSTKLQWTEWSWVEQVEYDPSMGTPPA